MLLLDTGFPVPVVPATSGFPRSPLALLTAGRTDFFMLSPLMLVHLHLGLDVEGGKEKGEEHLNAQRKLRISTEEKIISANRRERNHFHHSEHQKTLVSSCRSINRRSNSKTAATPTAEW